MLSLGLRNIQVWVVVILAMVTAGGWICHFQEIVDQWILGVSFPVPDTMSNGSIVISGTSSGIGRATCGYLAKQYPTVTMYCGVRNLEIAAEATTAAAAGNPEYPFDLPNVQAVLLDVTRDDHIENVMAQVQRPLLAVVSNAGMAELGTLEFQSLQVMERQYQVNVLGSLRLIRAALPLLRVSSSSSSADAASKTDDQDAAHPPMFSLPPPPSPGRIVMVSSASARIPGFPKWGAYQSSKAALETISDALRRELVVQNISVSIIEPGFITTPLVERASEQFTTSIDHQNVSQLEQDLYPHLYDPNYVKVQTEVMKHGGPMEETCQAIDHAITSPHPRTRYLTSRLGLLPTSVFIAVNTLFITDRLSDWVFANMKLQGLAVQLQPIQAEMDAIPGGMLGYFWKKLRN